MEAAAGLWADVEVVVVRKKSDRIAAAAAVDSALLEDLKVGVCRRPFCWMAPLLAEA